jgi:hypothetical protein
LIHRTACLHARLATFYGGLKVFFSDISFFRCGFLGQREPGIRS